MSGGGEQSQLGKLDIIINYFLMLFVIVAELMQLVVRQRATHAKWTQSSRAANAQLYLPNAVFMTGDGVSRVRLLPDKFELKKTSGAASASVPSSKTTTPHKRRKTKRVHDDDDDDDDEDESSVSLDDSFDTSPSKRTRSSTRNTPNKRARHSPVDASDSDADVEDKVVSFILH